MEDLHPLIRRSKAEELQQLLDKAEQQAVCELLSRLSEIKFPREDITTKTTLLFQAREAGIGTDQLIGHLPLFFKEQPIKKLQSFINSGQAYVDFIRLLSEDSPHRLKNKLPLKHNERVKRDLFSVLDGLERPEKERYLQNADLLEPVLAAARKRRDRFNVDPAAYRTRSFVEAQRFRSVSRRDSGRSTRQG